LEYVDGCNLERFLPEIPGCERENVALYLAFILTGAVFEAHRLGIIHGDISSRNILISKQGEVKLSDFGQPLKGSLDYLSPQRWNGHPPTVKSDLFALGILIYQILVGFNPLYNSQVGQIKKNLDSFLLSKPWNKFSPVFIHLFEFLLLGQGEWIDLKSMINPDTKKILLEKMNHVTDTLPFLTRTVTVFLPKSLWAQKLFCLFLLIFISIGPAAVSQDGAQNDYKRPCILTVTSQPWGEVFIDGISQGYTPLIDLPLKAGYHSLLWRNYEGQEIKKTITAFGNGVLWLKIR
jgi:serine/threonine protein kinase